MSYSSHPGPPPYVTLPVHERSARTHRSQADGCTPGPSETDSLLGGPQYNRSRVFGIPGAVIMCLVVLVVYLLIQMGPTCPESADRMEKARICEEWDLKRRAHDAETAQLNQEIIVAETRLTQLREAWIQEQDEYEHQRREEEEEHREQEQKRREDEARAREEDRRREKEERDKLRLFWNQPERHPRCAAFGKREYTATLQNLGPGYDWYMACTETAIEINGRVLESPNRCEHAWWKWWINEVKGHWIADYGESECRPRWDRMYDDGCVGDRSGLRRHAAALYNLREGDDWYVMCRTTPNVIQGLHFDEPTSCEHRHYKHGAEMVGIWDITDEHCL